ncbi:MAG: hypothetical protein Q7T76_14620, partial [Ferruginibacter sp.]|nr:hypothetical protein [Ferruginibacter sp.]
SEGFESFTSEIFTKPEMAIGENQHIDFTSSTTRGRVRSFVNTGFSYSGTKALTLDQAPFNTKSTKDSVTFSYNLVNYIGKQLRWDFHYRNHGQDTSGANKVWVRGSESNNWIQAYDLYTNQAATGDWRHANLNLNELLENAVPAQTITPTFQIKIGQEGINSANSARPVNGFEDGYTFDDLVLNEVLNDVAVIKINSPSAGDCALSNATSVSIKIKNYNNATLNNIAVSYRVNGGAIVTENVAAVAPNQTLDYVFSTQANMSAYSDYSIDVWAKYAADSYANNDSILSYSLHNSPVVSSFPYLESFESGDGFFYSRGVNNTWAWGSPTKLIINKAANGAKAWVTNLTGNYKDNETSYLYSPCFNTAALTQPMLSFSHIFHIETGYDFTWVEYSTDGVEWQKLGTNGSGTNWYDSVTTGMWTLSKARWHVATVALPTGVTNLKIRFVLNTDGGLREEGVGIDDFHLYDKAAVYEGPVLTNVLQAVNGPAWVNFSSGGKLIAAVNPGGADLGATTVQVHKNAGPVRNSNNAYYADRNIVIKPATPPSQKVNVRFYFTDAEVQALLAANGCTFCAKPLDAYELGITKYSSGQPNENGMLSDDTTGFFDFIHPDSTIIIPYDNGYYAEFSVNSFSEFWLSSENIRPSVAGVCRGEDIVFVAASTGSSYQWQEDDGSGFVNIANSPIYSGVTMAQLFVSNYTSSISSKRYRCIVNGIAGAINTPRFVNVWTGADNTDWALASNWSCGFVPDQYTEVVIPGGLTNYPVVSADTTIKSLRVYPGASGRLATGAHLDIRGR